MSDETRPTDDEALEQAGDSPESLGAGAPDEEASHTETEAAVAVEELDAEPAEAVEPVVDEELDADGETAEQADAEEEDVEEEDDSDKKPTIAIAPSGPIEELTEEDLQEDINLDWYILKVQSNRERTSSEALKRKVAIEGIQHLFGDIIVPTEKVTEFKNGKKKTVQRKIWPGYIAVQMHVNDDTWFAIRETAGIGDFTGASGKPIPMSPEDVEKILPKDEAEENEENVPKLNIKFAEADKVKVTDGNFENFEGEVDTIDHQSGKVTVMISIFGRSTPVELEYWQVEKL